jgi:hypothetical protein
MIPLHLIYFNFYIFSSFFPSAVVVTFKYIFKIYKYDTIDAVAPLRIDTGTVDITLIDRYDKMYNITNVYLVNIIFAHR